MRRLSVHGIGLTSTEHHSFRVSRKGKQKMRNDTLKICFPLNEKYPALMVHLLARCGLREIG
jgi:hypothetical protein